MRRHQKLQDLSREHYSALKLAVNARRAVVSGDPAQVAAQAAACRAAFLVELDPHFLFEESTLLPLLAQAGEQDLVARTINEHAQMRALIAQLQAPTVGALGDFAELLSAHVRFEERELFEAVQHLLD